jgi:lipopolysaccharide transport system ATP-binding protein
MSAPVIEAVGLGKKYRLHHAPSGGREGLRHVLQRAFSGTRRQERAAPADEDFWALRDVSFQIGQGEAVGIIGRNGAGKSTLLKILSRITEPTTGRVTLNGRVASLLEVGTGFHHELTGRENIYLNGTILGMTRAEIRRKFDEIVSFAEIERFLDTPVKHYSSGMYVRLAFAVAAHLEPEILVVDEVLAVGDVAFQKKCLGKMEDVSRREGRTVLFVSHNMSAISTLTRRVILLNRGGVEFSGEAQEGIHRYLNQNETQGAIYTAAPAPGRPSLVRAEVETSEPGQVQNSGRPWLARFSIHFPSPRPGTCLSIQIVNQAQNPILHLVACDHPTDLGARAGTAVVECRIERLRLNVGAYHLKLYLSEPPGGETFEVTDHLCPFAVEVLNRTTLFGWRPEACAYLEEAAWTVQAS